MVIRPRAGISLLNFLDCATVERGRPEGRNHGKRIALIYFRSTNLVRTRGFLAPECAPARMLLRRIRVPVLREREVGGGSFVVAAQALAIGRISHDARLTLTRRVNPCESSDLHAKMCRIHYDRWIRWRFRSTTST